MEKLTFVITTKDEELIELLHAVIHDLMDSFTGLYKNSLSKEFDGAVAEFQNFSGYVENILISHGLDLLDDAIRDIDDLSTLKSIVYLEPKGGTVFYIHVFFVSILLAYFPFSKLMHLGGIFLSPTRNLTTDTRAKRHINPWNYPVPVHTYEEYEDEFRDKMIEVGIPVDKMPEPKPVEEDAPAEDETPAEEEKKE